jgi:hypothetical protein
MFLGEPIFSSMSENKSGVGKESEEKLAVSLWTKSKATQ